ncbi:MAG: hypothetical protein JL50_16505 [Peptococcaceae bacterium BICA1-7]|nr:MAG: hypothetical protein JL50_16505 [Peptococcaceae bacterium BICA1-7]
MKADSVSMTPTAVAVSGNKYCGTDHAIPGDFIMALMGALLQQGGIADSAGQSPGGTSFQQGQVVSGLLPPELSVAGTEGLSSQGQVEELVSELLPGNEKGAVGGENITSILIPSAVASNSGSAMSPEGITQPGQAEALGIALPGNAVSGQEANGSAQVRADGEIGPNLQALKGGETGANVQALKGGETGANVQVLKGGETSINVQVQVDTGSSEDARAPQAASTLQHSTATARVAGVITTVNSDQMLPDAAVPKGVAADYLLVNNSLPSGLAKNNVSVPGGEGENGYQTFAAVEEQPQGDPAKIPDNRLEKASSIDPAVRLDQKIEGTAAQAAGYGRNEAAQGARNASATAVPVEDGAAEIASITDSNGAEGKESDARPGGFGLQGDMQVSTGTQLSNITGRKLAAEIMPYVLNSLKNSEGEKNRVTVLRLKLEPENLGEIKIRLTFVKGELTAHFYTASGLVKDAVEGSLPQLRETLGQYNINLGEAGAYVGQEQQNRSGGKFGGYQQGGAPGHRGINYSANSSGDSGRSEPGQGSSSLNLLI